MGKVRTGLAVSLDGFVSGPNDGPEAPMGGVATIPWMCRSLLSPADENGRGPFSLAATSPAALRRPPMPGRFQLGPSRAALPRRHQATARAGAVWPPARSG